MLVNFNFLISLALKDEVILAIISDGRLSKADNSLGCLEDEELELELELEDGELEDGELEDGEMGLGFASPPLNLVLRDLVFGVFFIIFSFELKFIKLIVDDSLVVECWLITIGVHHKHKSC